MLNMQYRSLFNALAISFSLLLVSCGTAENTGRPDPNDLTPAEAVTQLESRGFTCTTGQITELNGSKAVNPTTQCIIPNQNGLQIAVAETGSVLGTVDATGAFTASGSNDAATRYTVFTAFNTSPQVENLSGGTFDKVTRIISENTGLTSIELAALINYDLTTGIGINPAINGVFNIIVRGDTAVPQTVIKGNKTAIAITASVGPTYALSSVWVPILDNSGAAVGVNALLGLTNSVISVVGMGGILGNGTYQLGDLSLIDSSGNVSTYPQKGVFVVNKCDPLSATPNYDPTNDICSL